MSQATRQSPKPQVEPPSSDINCYHCGEKVPAGVNFEINLCGESRPMCCPGCRAVASLIAGGGMENFYQQRTSFSPRPEAAPLGSAPSIVENFLHYDDPELAATFTEELDSDTCRARILLGGMTCAACTWLIEQSLLALPGIKKATVHLGQSRLEFEYSTQDIRLSQVFDHITALGYKARPFAASTARQQMSAEYKTSLKRLAVAGLGMMQVGMFAIALHAGDIQGMQEQYQNLLRWVSLLVTSFIVLYCARSFFSTAWRHLKIGAFVMDLPVALAIGLAWLASAWATISNSGQVYFDSVVMFTFFLLLARFLELRVRLRNAWMWFDVEESLPTSVLVKRDEKWVAVTRKNIEVGDIVLLKAGETIAVDATITNGSTAVEESAFNGEELPRLVHPRDTVFAGTVNMEGAVEAQVTGACNDTRLALLQRSMERGESEKPALAKLADRIASRFVVAVIILTSLTAAIWLTIDPQQALWVSLSVLVISCPCALSLATPAALTAAANSLRSHGVIVKGENALESLARITHILFDKTGTLTQGKLAISEVVCLGDIDQSEVLSIAAGLQCHSNHPVAQAFNQLASRINFDRVDYKVGAGLHSLDDYAYSMGSESFCRAYASTLPPPPKEPLYWVGLCKGDTPLAWIGLSDTPRSEAKNVVQGLQVAGLNVELLTGDSSEQGPVLAAALDIKVMHKGMEPQQKMDYVQQLQRDGAVVAMVGDGLNDAPVLSVANTSFAVAGATDLARTKADFLLVEQNLHAVNNTWITARKARQIVIQNFSWALGYNIVAIPLAALGLVPPWAAAIGMSLSSVLVVLNSLRLNR